MKELLLSFIDLTTLSIDDTKEKVINLCKKGINKKVAAICIYPIFVPLVHNILASHNIKTASVAGCFPAAQSPIEIKTAEVKYAACNGADEIDIVISAGKIIEGDYDAALYEIQQMRNVSYGKTMKCILETGALKTPELIQKAAEIAIEGGADFIKTSTGKISTGATIDASTIMLESINKYFKKTGKKIGFKAAGGISTYETALSYIYLVKDILGEEWLKPELFRIGASRLVDAL